MRVFFGCLAAVACGILYAAYLSAFHDRKFWFSARQVGSCVVQSADRLLTLYFHFSAIIISIHLNLSQEVEREITFQGGSGLYYYYYKHMLTAPSFERGIWILFASY